MVVAPTIRLANEINKRTNKFKVHQIKLPVDRFGWYVDSNVWSHEQDFDYATGLFKLLVVEYPEDYYACERYITSRDLHEAFENCDKTISGFIDTIIEMYEI